MTQQGSLHILVIEMLILERNQEYKTKFGLSFRYSVDKGKDGKPVIGFLERQGYIETFSFQYDRNNPNNSYRSRMRATPKLIDLIVNQHKVTEDMVETDVDNEETIIFKGLKPKPKHIDVIENGKRKRKKIQGRRKICKTPDTPIVREMRKNLEIINEVMEKAEITLEISEEELRELNARMLDDPNKQAIDFSRKKLRRVFLDRRPDLGGRFYGPWYQNIPKEYRQYIMINMLRLWSWITLPYTHICYISKLVLIDQKVICMNWRDTRRKHGIS